LIPTLSLARIACLGIKGWGEKGMESKIKLCRVCKELSSAIAANDRLRYAKIHVDCDDDGIVRLTGKVVSWYHKQVVTQVSQQAINGHAGEITLENRIFVPE
jgi:hypothetical protein